MRAFRPWYLLAGLMLLIHVQVAFAAPEDGVWYDANRMAIAINLGHPSWENYSWMEMDFNADRTWNQVIAGRVYHYINEEMVRRYDFGVAKAEVTPYGESRTYWWTPDHLFENDSLSGWATYASPLDYYGQRNPEGLHCFTDLWLPATEERTVYCRPMDAAGNSQPVLSEDLDHIYIKFGYQDWTSLPFYHPPAAPLLVGMEITPNILSADTQGNYVTIKIDLPADVPPSSVNMDMNIVMANYNNHQMPVDSWLKPVKWTSYESGWKNGLQQLSFKVQRSELTHQLGTFQIAAFASLNNGRSLTASSTMTVR